MSALPAFSQQGQGSTAVLLLHGIGGGQSIWNDAASGTSRALAAAGYRALALDLPGYGASAAMAAMASMASASAAGGPDMDMFVAATRAVIAHVDAARVVLVGHSMGGMVAQELLARHGRDGGRIQGLALACTSASFGSRSGDWQARFLAERLAPLDAGLGMAAVAQRLVPQMVAPGTPAAAQRCAMDVMARVPEPTYRAALRAIANFDRRDALAAIDVPTLLLAAEHDRTAPPDVMQRMAARIAGARYVCLPGAGHIANVEQPAAFNTALLSFLQQHFAGA